MRVLLENWALPSESRQEDPWGRRQQVEELEQQGRPYIWIDHGLAPKGASFSYEILPGM